MPRGRRKIDPMSRFWPKVNKMGPISPSVGTRCWLWRAGVDSKGYGLFWDGRHHKAHRYLWVRLLGKVPEGRELCHRCDTPRCVRPSHVFVGTHKDNMADASAKGRLASGTRSGAHTHPEKWKRGESNWRAVLTEGAVRQIRERFARGGATKRALGREFGVSSTTILHIIQRKMWAHVP